MHLLKRFTRTRIWGCSIFIRGKSSLMLTKSKSHFLFTVARECVRLIKIIHESSQGAKNTDQLFYTYTFWHIWFLLFHQKSDTHSFYREGPQKPTILKVRNSSLKCGQNHRITKYGLHRVPITSTSTT